MCDGEKESMSPGKPRELFVNITDKEDQCAAETDAGSSHEPDGLSFLSGEERSSSPTGRFITILSARLRR